MPVILVLEAEMGGSQMKPGSRRKPCCLKDKHQVDFSCRINHALHLSFCFLWGFFFKWSLCVPNHLSESGVVSFLHWAIFLKMGGTTTAVWAPAAMWTQWFYYPLQVGFLSVLLSSSAIDRAVKESGKDLHLLDTDASQLMVTCVLLPTSPWEHNGGSNDYVIAWIFFLLYPEYHSAP